MWYYILAGVLLIIFIGIIFFGNPKATKINFVNAFRLQGEAASKLFEAKNQVKYHYIYATN